MLAQPGMLGLMDERGGFLVLRLVLDEAEIFTLGVTRKREGIATDLLKEGIELLRRRDIAIVHLEVAAPNVAARALYEKAGFTQSGLRRRYYADGSDAPHSREGSGRFLKKAAQKLLLCWAMGVVADNAHGPA